MHDLTVQDKLALLVHVQETLAHSLRQAQTAASDAAREATHEDAKAEDKYDTRALELTYLAAGQNERIETMRKALQTLHFWQPKANTSETIQAGALVLAQDTTGLAAEQWYWLVPAAVGGRFVVRGTPIAAVSTSAPIGEALLGAMVADEVRVGAKRLTVLEII